jgi:Mg-chelatase subunit ChlD
VPRRAFCILFGVLVFLTPWALSSSELQVGPVYLDRFPEVEAVVEVPGPVGSPVALPATGDLTLVEDGRPTVTAKSVRPFRQTGQGLAVVVAVDVSGTMAGEPLRQIQSSLLALVKDLQPQDRIALVSFADDIQVEAPFGTPVEQVRARISALAPRGRITELYRALFKSFEQFTPDLPVRRRVLVISDGRDEGEAYQLEDVIRRAQELEVPVDSIGLTRIDPKYLSTLERLSNLSGGFYSPAGPAADVQVQDLVRKGLERVRSTPVATFAVQDLKLDGQSHRLGVRWRQGRRLLEDETQVALLGAQLPNDSKKDNKDDRDNKDGGRTVLWIGVSVLLLLAIALAVWKSLSSRRPAPAAQPLSGLPGPAPAPARSPTVSEAAAAPIPPTRLEDDLPLRPAPVSEPAAELPTQRSASRGKTRFRLEFSAPAAGQPAAVLVGEGDLSGQRFLIEEDPFWIGAAEGNQLALEGDDFLSSHHACIRFQDGSLLLYDNRSTNGTFLNDERLTERPHPLGPGDRIRVGHSNFLVMAP